MRCCFLILDSALADGKVRRCRIAADMSDVFPSDFCPRHTAILTREPSDYETAALNRVGLTRDDIGPQLWSVS
jgi:hypothetical protein